MAERTARQYAEDHLGEFSGRDGLQTKRIKAVGWAILDLADAVREHAEVTRSSEPGDTEAGTGQENTP